MYIRHQINAGFFASGFLAILKLTAGFENKKTLLWLACILADNVLG